MSASRDSHAAAGAANQEGEFGSRVPPTGPETTKGHKPGILRTQEELAPETNLEILPPGTAPPSKTYEPQNEPDIPRQGLDNPADAEAGAGTHVEDTLTGATSADVHTGLGHPGQGMSSAEIRHDGVPKREKQSHGLQGVGAPGATHHSEDPSKHLDTESPIPGSGKKLAGGAPITKGERDEEDVEGMV